MACIALCIAEEEWEDPLETPTIIDSECIVRAAFNGDINDKGIPKPSAFPASKLFKGEMSIWREDYVSKTEIVKQTQTNLKQGSFVHSLYSVQAVSVRELQLENVKRLLCVVNDTETGPTKSDRHPAHATVKLCASFARRFGSAEEACNDSNFAALRVRLRQLFSQNCVWKFDA